MLQNLISPRAANLSLEEVLELANKRIELARKEGDTANALELINNAESLLKDAENIFATLSKGIGNAYHEHGKLLDDFGHHDKAKKSHSKAEEWGYVHFASRHTGSSQPLGKSGTIHRLLLPTVALSVAPGVTTAMCQDRPKTDTTRLDHQDHASPATPNKDVKIPQKIFDQNITPPIVKYALPEPNGRITSTSQLAYCLSLLHPSMISKEELDQSECDWLGVRVDDPDEHERLQTMATDVVRAFIQEELKKPGVVAEVASLAAVLGQDDFRKLLQAFVDGINQSLLLDVHLLNGLAQLIRNAPQEYIDADDLVKILQLLNACLKDTHKQSTQHTYQLSLTISQVLDSMVDSQVKGLSREQLHEPLSDYLAGLQQNSDPYLIYQAAYAYQALQYIPDDETILQSMMRRTGKVVQGISGVVSAVKALDLVGFIEGLQSVQQSLAGAEKVIGFVGGAYSNAVALAESGQGLLASLKDCFKHKSSWYPALRGLDRLIQEGRFLDFEKLLREAPCQYDPVFRWGVCQRLGEIAANTVWDLNTRKCAVDFLIQLYNDDASKGRQFDIRQWILSILNQLAESSKDIMESSAHGLLLEAQANNSSGEGVLYHGCGSGSPVLHPIMATPPSMESSLLDCVQDIPDVETPLRQLRLERLKGRGGDIYISPRAKASPRATDTFDLTGKVQEFLNSDKKVFLLLGDSGVGKSTFNRALEISLWDNYEKTNGRIPLFIHLPAIEKPERDLIAERLRKVNFTESQILELKLHREFILICDGYDESQQTRNLYMSNSLNQPGEWRAQMVISCRTEYNGVDYKHCFEPADRNSNREAGLFQEAVILPFDKDQSQAYVEQYVTLMKPSWGSEDYQQALQQIPNLQDLVKNPFLLKIALEVLPRLLGDDAEYSTTHVTRTKLYDEFVAQWVERSKRRLAEMKLSPRDELAFKELSNTGFHQRGITYLKELVTAIYDNQNGNPVVTYSEYQDRATWKEAFFSERDGSQLLREVIPLTRNGDQYRFIHKSLLEYGLSLAIFGPSGRNEETEPTEPTSSVSRRGSTSSVFSFECSPSTEETATADSKSLLDSPLGKRNLVGEQSILQFLTERAQQEVVFKDQLHSVIELSKVDKAARIAAANAITILVRAGVQFIGADLRNIKIPGADLSFGMFDSAQLEGADLRKVNLRCAWMREANLRGAQMKGVQFGELPLLQEDSMVFFCAYSPDGKTHATGLQDGKISLYETSNWRRIQRLEGHSDSVFTLSFSTTSDRIASGSDDFTVRLWDVDTGDCIHTLQGHSGGVKSVVYLPKGDRIASGSIDNTVRLWDVDTGECVYILRGHNSDVKSVVYSPKENQIASGSDDRTVQLWDVDTGECIHTLQGHSDYVQSVVYSPNGAQIASGSSDCTVRLWDVDTGECIQTLEGHSASVDIVAYSPKGDRIVSGSFDCTLRLWDCGTGECVHILQGHSWSVGSVAYLPKGNRIASGSYDSTVRLWDVDTGECVHILRGHSGFVNSVAYSPKGDRIASGSSDCTVRLWDVNTGERVHTSQVHLSRVISVAYSPRGDWIASGSFGSALQLWDVDTGECVHTLGDHDDVVLIVVYSPEGDQIASVSYGHTVRLWDVDTGECVHILYGHSLSINCVIYSPKGDQIASGSDDETVRLWNIDTGECAHTLEGHGFSVRSVVYSPEGDRIASGSGDDTVRLWDVDTGECIHILYGHSYDVNSVVYSPSGDRIVSVSNDKTIRLWDVDTGECIHTLQDHTGLVVSVAYSPSGDRIATGSNDKTVRLWDVNTGECIHTLQGHNGRVFSVVYSPEEDWVASGSDDRTVKLWDVETGQCHITISGFSDRINSIALGGDFGAWCLVIGSDDKSVRRWQITKEKGRHKAVLCWSSSHDVLMVWDLSFEDAQGLSRMNQELLIQRGALIPASLSSN